MVTQQFLELLFWVRIPVPQLNIEFFDLLIQQNKQTDLEEEWWKTPYNESLSDLA